jgi:site-specific recombinase XerD
MATFNYYLREPSSDTSTPIVLHIHYMNVRIKFPTNESIEPKFWDSERQEVKKSRNFPTNPEFNLRLRNLKALAEDTLRTYLNDNEQQFPSTAIFKKQLNEKLNPKTKLVESENQDLLGFCEEYLIKCETRLNPSTGKPINQNTIRVYRQAYRELKGFKDKFYKNRPFNFEHIDHAFYTQFKEYLINHRNYSTNTVGKHLKTLKSFFLEAQSKGLMPNFVSRKFKSVSEKTDAIYLNVQELAKLLKLDLNENKRLERVRDLFLVGCWTGLRFSDFTRITSKNINGGFIKIQAQKTGETVVLPIHDDVTLIMDRYKGVTENSLPQPMTNQKMNSYLKELGKVAKLDEAITRTFTKGGKKVTEENAKYQLLTTHTARRSFATNQYLSGLEAITIMHLTGHRTEKAFMKYIKVTSKEHAIKLREMWESEKNPSIRINKSL